MSDRDELLALASRVEKLTGPDREVDAAIAIAVHGGEILWRQSVGTMEAYPARRYKSRDHISGFGHAPVDAVTASFDAALMLVPEGWTYAVLERCAYGLPGQHCRASLERLVGDDEERTDGYAVELPLAIVAAALRARAGAA